MLEGMLEEQFYQPRQHLFFHGEKQEEKKADPAEDSEIMEQITKDIQYKDLPHLRQDFRDWKKNIVHISNFRICM